MKFGDFCKARRMSMRKTLGKFCQENNFDAVAVSQIEHNFPLDKGNQLMLLTKYARALNINFDTIDWSMFTALAEASKKEERVVSDEMVLVNLPAIVSPEVASSPGALNSIVDFTRGNLNQRALLKSAGR
ncbi:MAG: hypothetical protein FWD15_01835 [Alphaproteobacteria bacterium]|nr:hypothetical protein [Alphaproteobacteria bacterium]